MNTEDIIKFFRDTKDIDDNVIHAWAEKEGIDTHEFEGLIYKTLKDLVNLKDSELPDDKFDSKELEMGIKVEKEHTNSPIMAKAIAKAHLNEMPDYYTKLLAMEKANESFSTRIFKRYSQLN